MTIMPEDEKCLYDAKKVRGRILIMGSEANSDLQRDGILKIKLENSAGEEPANSGTPDALHTRAQSQSGSRSFSPTVGSASDLCW